MPSGKATTRYEQVKDILDEATGKIPADDGGQERVWELKLKDFKSARICGIAVLPGAPSKTQCGCAEGDAPAAPAVQRASEVSGLIMGLRGQAPFDGSCYPPLPWDGDRVSDDDIDFIADWIDDGCPEDDRLLSHAFEELQAKGGEVARIEFGKIKEFEVCEGGINAHKFRQSEVRQRANIDCMPEAQIDELRKAFRATYDLCKWENDRRSFNNQALIHQNHCQHGWERFLPWHRAYNYEFEQNLRDFFPDVMLPYWDWTMTQYRPEKPECGWVIPPAFKAFLTEEAVERLLEDKDRKLKPDPDPKQKKAFKALAEKRKLFNSQNCFFRHVVNEIGYEHVTPKEADQNRRRMIDALLDSNALWYPLRYPAEYSGGVKITEARNYHYPSAKDMREIMQLNNFRDFGGGSLYYDSFGFLDQNPHNTMHIWTGGENQYRGKDSYAEPKDTEPGSEGPEDRNLACKATDRPFHRRKDLYSQPGNGDMFSNLTASYDPIFWPIHVNVDRIWWQWQGLNPHGLPLDLEAILTPWSYTVRDTLSIEPFGYEYVRGSYLMPVGLEATVGRFVSQPIKVPKPMRDFRRAEIRLHRVPQLLRSCFVRAFLNQPGADASTAVRDNPHFAGYLAIFGHGLCYGG
nr:tyrosinase family protein [Alphaproteobacteria bacterium]